MKKLVLLPAIVAASVAVQSPAQAATVQELEERLIKLEKNDRRSKFRIRSMKKAMSEADEKFRVNGFFSAGFSTFKTSNDQGFFAAQNFDGKITNKVQAEAETHVGIQFTNKVNDKTDFVTQIIGRGGNDFKATIEWAFLKHDFTDDITLRAGRLRTPFFQLSEFLEVQYAMPWVRGPQEIYGSSISSYTGADLLYRKRLAGINFAAQVFYGSDDSIGANGAVRVRLDQLVGFRLSAEYKGFKAGFGLSDANATFSDFTEGDLLENIQRLQGGLQGATQNLIKGVADGVRKQMAGLPEAQINTAIQQATAQYTSALTVFSTPYVGENTAIKDGTARFANVSLGYSNGPLDIQAEAIKQEVDGVFQDEEAHYLSVAYRFGDFTPYAYIAKVYTTDDEKRAKAVAQLVEWEKEFEPIKTNILGTLPPSGFEAFKISEAANGLKTAQKAIQSFTGEQSSYALGVRWDFMANLALKFEYQRIQDAYNSPRTYPDDLSKPETEPQGNMELYTITINGVF